MRFESREQAATLLAERLTDYAGRSPLVLGVPRGGVPMARLVADTLGGETDVVLVRKLRAPRQPELAIGAVDESGLVLEGDHYAAVASDAYIAGEIETQVALLRRRREQYTRARPPIDPVGRVVIIVDDGVATGSSMLAAIRSVRVRQPSEVVVAVACAPTSTVKWLEEAADHVVCLVTDDWFQAVSQYYEDFSEVTDEEVVAALAAPRLEPAVKKE